MKWGTLPLLTKPPFGVDSLGGKGRYKLARSMVHPGKITCWNPKHAGLEDVFFPLIGDFRLHS